MESNSLIILNLKQALKDLQGQKKYKISLFGSVLDNRVPNDIDLIIIYDKAKTTLVELLEFKKALNILVQEISNLPSDFSFIESTSENAILFFRKVNFIPLNYDA